MKIMDFNTIFMKRTLLLTLLVAASTFLAGAQELEVNYDKNKIRPFTLEDPLTFFDCSKVKTEADWANRRLEILDIFQKEMYGQCPAKPDTVILETIEEGTTLMGFAHRKQIRMYFRPDKSGPFITWLILTPNAFKGPRPTVLMLNYNGNQEILADKEIEIPQITIFQDKEPFKEESRGALTNPNQRNIVPANMILARGYAYVTACYEEISPDPDPAASYEKKRELQDKYAYTRIFDLWPKRDPSRTDNTTSLMAWAWGLMRGMDMIERLPELDQQRVLLTGYSRLGKAALIAGAFDQRFPIVVPNQTGGGGIPLAKHFYGENVNTEIHSFTHWYCRGYDKYAENEDALPFDQHLFVSCIAPRAFLCEGFDEPWYDTESEFICLQNASKVWEFLGREGLPKVSFPDDYDTKAIGFNLGYVRRDLEHGISAQDWQWMLDFSDRYIKEHINAQ